MNLGQSARSVELAVRLTDFMADHVYPNERRFYQEAECLGPWRVLPVVEELKSLSRAASLWNLFLPAAHGGLSNLDYAPLCEIMGRSHLAPEVFNCSALAPVVARSKTSARSTERGVSVIRLGRRFLAICRSPSFIAFARVG